MNPLTWVEYWTILTIVCGEEWLKPLTREEIEHCIDLGLITRQIGGLAWELTDLGRAALREAVTTLLTSSQEHVLRRAAVHPTFKFYAGKPTGVRLATLQCLGDKDLMRLVQTDPWEMYTISPAGIRLAAAIADLPRKEAEK